MSGLKTIFGSGWDNPLSQNRNDIVFENRNKAYGAYELRQRYNNYILLALLAGIGLIGLGVAGPYIASIIKKAGPKEEVTVLDYTELPPPPSVEKPPPPPKVKTPPPPPIKQIKFIPPVITKAPDRIEEVEQALEKPEPVINNNPGPTEVSQPVDPGPMEVKQPDPEPPKVVEPEPPKEDNKVYDFVQVKAEFPGGTQAMYKWLSANCEYPRIAKENGITGRTIVEFVVLKDGSIKDVKVLKGFNELCDKAAVEAVKKMPSWKPANQNGNTVNSKFQLPVFFKLE
ncbi:MAG: TonB family protein [Chitinophagales bacterium]|nr:TonB family protein [Chitinophagales bacterium]